MKLQAQSSKLKRSAKNQAPNTRETPNTKHQTPSLKHGVPLFCGFWQQAFGIWDLEFVWFLVFGFWCF